MICALRTSYHRDGIDYNLEFNRDPSAGKFWACDLWIKRPEQEMSYEGIISGPRDTNLDIVVAAAACFMREQYGFKED